VSAGLLVIGFGMIAGVQAATSDKAGTGNGWMVAGICVAAVGALALAVAVVMYLWPSKSQRQEPIGVGMSCGRASG
jgi:hypothetical protein